jgi:hypothetical protein
MANTEPLTELLRRKKAQDEALDRDVDWTARKQAWLEAVESLYRDVESWLQPSVTEGLIELRRRPIELREQHLGAYEIDELVLQAGRSEVRFTPVGRLIVGAQGRIDVHGGPDVVKLVRLDEHGWVEVSDDEGPYRSYPLTKAQLTRILERFFGE